MSQQVGRPKAETEAVGVERKTAKDLGQNVQRVDAHNMRTKDAEGVTQKIQRAAHNLKEKVMGSDNKSDENSAAAAAPRMKVNEENLSEQKKMKDQKMSMDKKDMNMNKKDENKMTKADDIDWVNKYKTVDTDIRKQLKKGNTDLTSQLEKAYQGMIKNCLKQAEDEPHKFENCMNEFNSKMAPIYKQMQERSSESAATLKKCFESKRNAEECMQEGIKFGQKTLHDATNSIKAYLA